MLETVNLFASLNVSIVLANLHAHAQTHTHTQHTHNTHTCMHIHIWLHIICIHADAYASQKDKVIKPVVYEHMNTKRKDNVN